MIRSISLAEKYLKDKLDFDIVLSKSSSVNDSQIFKAESYKPTEAMKVAARRALRWKEEGKAKGAGTPVGWGRATDIAAGRSMSLDIVKRMFSFFSRHEVDKKGKDFDNTSDPSNGRIMWDAWGGDAGFTWSRAIVEREKRKLEKHLSGKHDQSSHGRKAGTMSTKLTTSTSGEITPRQKEAFKTYTEKAYGIINGMARTGSSKIPDKHKWNAEKPAAEYQKDIQELDDVINRSTLNESMELQRVVSLEAYGLDWNNYKPKSKWVEELKPLVGSVITDKGFFSTTKKATIPGILQDDSKVKIKVFALKGAKGIDVAGMKLTDLDEGEVIFGRNTSYRVLSVGQGDSDYAATMEVEIAP